MTVECEVVECCNRYIIKYIVKGTIEDEEFFRISYNIANKKSRYTMPIGTSGTKRNKMEILNKHFRGKLGVLCVKNFIQKHCQCDVVDYDDIRKNEYKRPDEFDLMIGEKILEVRTSLLPKEFKFTSEIELLKYVLDNLRLLGPYTIQDGKPKEKPKDIYIQIIYPYVKYEFDEIFINLLNGNEIDLTLHIFGFDTIDVLKEQGETFFYGASKYLALKLYRTKDITEICKHITKT